MMEVSPAPGAPALHRAKLIRCAGTAWLDDPAERAKVTALLNESGAVVLRGLGDLTTKGLMQVGALFGEVENLVDTKMPAHMVHKEEPHVMDLSANFSKRDKDDDGSAITFPDRPGWHTDQSFRRPPPDVTCLYCKAPPPPPPLADTLVADAVAAFEALPEEEQAWLSQLTGLHAYPNTGRSYLQALGDPKAPPQLRKLSEEEKPLFWAIPQPLARVHPVTGRRSLYMCEKGQMDWVEGPIQGMEPGPEGEGGRLLFRLMTHVTDRQFVYRHAWEQFDLLVWDNRQVIHAATPFDTKKYNRQMWRCTMSGNPGSYYDDVKERPSWEAAATAEGGTVIGTATAKL